MNESITSPRALALARNDDSSENVNSRESFIAHNGDWDTLLVRVGHRLWSNYKKTKDPVILRACESVWAAKREYRIPMIVARNAARAAKSARMIARHGGCQ